MIFDFALIDIAAGKVANLGKSFSNVLETELAFLTDNTKVLPATSAGVIDIEAIEAVQTQAPVLIAVKVTEELNYGAVKYGPKVVNNAIKVVEKNPKLLSLENSLADTVDLVVLRDGLVDITKKVTEKIYYQNRIL